MTTREEELKNLPLPYNAIESFLYYMATGTVSKSYPFPKKTFNRLETYLRCISKYGIAASRVWDNSEGEDL